LARRPRRSTSRLHSPRRGGACSSSTWTARPRRHGGAASIAAGSSPRRRAVCCFLDRLAANIRAESGAAISRAQLIRSLVDAVADADIDLTAATSESDLKLTILARLGRYASTSEAQKRQ
jgi:hypothetical protein